MSIIKTCLTHEAPHLYEFTRGDSTSYNFVYRFPGNPHQKALAIGSKRKISLEQAKGEAYRLNKMLTSIPPRDPARERIRDATTFGELFEDEKKKRSKDGGKDGQDWDRYARLYFPRLMSMRPCYITRDHVLDCLRDIWGTEKATRALYVISEVMKLAIARDLAIQNPAEKDVVVRILGAARTSEPELQASIPYPKMPAFLARVLSPKTGHWTAMGLARKCLVVQSVLPYRSREVSAMKWSEVNFETGEWKTEGDRNKIGMAQINILPAQVLAVLRTIEPVPGNPYVFAGEKAGEPIWSGASRDVMRKDMRIPNKEGSIHGMRRSLITFGQEVVGIDPVWVQDMLGHGPKKGVAKKNNMARYTGAQWIEKRKMLLQEWADHIFPADFLGSNVVQLRA